MSAPYRFELTGGVRDPQAMRDALERSQSKRSRRKSAAATVYRVRSCTCCTQPFEPRNGNQVDCLSCAELIPYRCRRLGRKVQAWSAERALQNSLYKKKAVA
jgi:hypothetical protein